MSISRDLTHRLGGHIRVTSEPGQGSTFEVTLPARTSEATAAQPTPTPAPLSRTLERVYTSPPLSAQWLQGRTLLIADDDVRNIFAMRQLLGTHGARLVIAENGQEALEQLDAHPEIELVLMDIMMPVMDGLEATRRIRAQERWRALPIIVITAKAVANINQDSLQAGASAHINKPLEGEDLFSLLQRHLSRP